MKAREKSALLKFLTGVDGAFFFTTAQLDSILQDAGNGPISADDSAKLQDRLRSIADTLRKFKGITQEMIDIVKGETERTH